MRTFMRNYVKVCGICQQFKIDRNPSRPAYKPIGGAKSTRPFASCSMDLITDLPPVDECDSILVVVDRGLQRGQFSSQPSKHSLQMDPDNFYSTTFTNDLDYQMRCYLTEAHNLLHTH